MRFADVVGELRQVRWGSAPAWNARVKTGLQAYYRRLLPFWPEDRRALEPADRAIGEAAERRRTEEERAQIADEVRAVIAASRERRERIEPATQALLPLILAWACAVDTGELARDADPGAPLVELFRAGYQIAYTHHGIELHHTAGWATLPVPTRAVVASWPSESL